MPILRLNNTEGDYHELGKSQLQHVYMCIEIQQLVDIELDIQKIRIYQQNDVEKVLVRVCVCVCRHSLAETHCTVLHTCW